MQEPEVEAFLQKRKEDWLKGKIKAKMGEEEKQVFTQEADQKFNLPNWVQDAAKRAGQLSMVTHPAKFSHPNAKTSNIMASTKKRADGLLRSGNVESIGIDIIGNAAALDVHKFLTLVLSDGKTLLAHLEENTSLVRHLFESFSQEAFEEVRQGLLQIKKGEEAPKTHGGIKQVYFPLDLEGEDYHLLSVLTPSPILYELKKRIQTMRFSEEAKASREARKKGQSAESFSDIFDLTRIGFGGTKPRNISVLNNQNGGVAYLLPASPPVLGGRNVHPPVRDFFDLSYSRPHDYQELFTSFHQTLGVAINHYKIRHKIQSLAKMIFFSLIDQSWQIRQLEAGWSDSDRYLGLPQYQKLWLDQQYRDNEQKDEIWLNTLEEKMVNWFGRAYQALFKDQAYDLSDYEFIALKQWLKSCEGGLK